ncbi:glycosyltransferase family 2 protein [Bacteroides pyogenes]|uniref:glycosyltransferase family 2 protein n=1 Tax=Bacteroides pyogenes TaxID=310300 RepID=UPI003B4363C1
MIKISVVMPTYNAEKYLHEAMDSVLKQSFADFEFIIVDDGSTDRTLEIIRSYKDKRIRLIENEHNFVETLNKGLTSACGKYIARMDADDIMYIDRLKIQYAIMQTEPTITVCSSWMSPFGENVLKGTIAQTTFGLIEQPLLHLLKGNMIFHPTVMIRTDFLRKHNLKYENYKYAEDYKLWLEIAKKKGVFYVESHPLLMYRISEQQVSKLKRNDQIEVLLKIKKEVLSYLFELNSREYTSLGEVFMSIEKLQGEGLMTDDDVFEFFFALFTRNKNSLLLD